MVKADRPRRSTRQRVTAATSYAEEDNNNDNGGQSDEASECESFQESQSSESILVTHSNNRPSRRAAATSKNKRSSSMSSSSEQEFEDETSSSVEEKVAPKKKRSRSSKKTTTTHQLRTATPRKHRPHHKSILEEETETHDSDIMSEKSEDEMSLEEAQDEVKMERVLASRNERRKDWIKICGKMKTSEIDSGSRFIQTDGDLEEKDADIFEERFLVKWKGLSHLHCSWELEADLVAQIDNAKNLIGVFFRKSREGKLYTEDERGDGDYFDPSWTIVDRLLEVVEADKSEPLTLDPNSKHYKNGRGRQFLIKWVNLGYASSSYEYERDLIWAGTDFESHLKAFEIRAIKPTKSQFKKYVADGEKERRRLYQFFQDEENIQDYIKELQGVTFKNGGKVRDYQAEGITWMFVNFINNKCSILADEMGLGKTVQTAAFINLIATKLKRRGPYLIIAPLSTLPHWRREFEGWTHLNIVDYQGSVEDREWARELEFAFAEDRPDNTGRQASTYLRRCHKRNYDTWQRTWQAEVVIMSPETFLLDDNKQLSAIDWEAIVIDEAHRIKNHNSRLATTIRDDAYSFNHVLLLTGTPIQNNMAEMWALLHTVDPNKFNNLDGFLEQFGNIKEKEKLDELHELIKPYILRRLKEDVEKSVPPKEETLIDVELTLWQKQYYRALYENNVGFLLRGNKRAIDGPSLINLHMELRKCCNHTFLINGAERDLRKEASDMSEGDFLVKASGKFVLLDKLLPRLERDGHRILLFSQFVIMLDIIEDYFRARNIKYERIDGSITGTKRQRAIDRFQGKESAGGELPLVMILTTKAGGVGINLTAADTCIIFDSDWNPQNDLQAQARCHRIGQTKEVKVYRLITSKTYEEQLFKISSIKMGLDQAVLHGLENAEAALSKEEIENLLRHGAYEIFNEEKAGKSAEESNAFEAADIDAILSRHSKKVVHEGTGTKANVAGGTFSKATFKVSNKDDNGAHDVDVNDPDFWKKMVGEAKPASEQKLTKRKRNRINYSEEGIRLLSLENNGKEDEKDDDESFNDSGRSCTSSPIFDDFEHESGSEKKRSKSKSFTKSSSVRGQWSKKDLNEIVSVLQTFGYDPCSPSHMTNKYEVSEVNHMKWSIIFLCLKEAAEDDYQNDQKKHATNIGGGVFGAAPNAMERSRLLNLYLNKVLSDNLWAKKVIIEAVSYSTNFKPRSKDTLDLALGRPVPPSTLQLAFNANLWPALRSRGWTSEVKGMVSYYKLGNDHIYANIPALLQHVSNQYTELRHAVSSLQSIPSSTVDNPAVLDAANLDYSQLSNFIDQFAPLPLLINQSDPKNKCALMSRKILSSIQFMIKVDELLAKASNNIIISSGAIGIPGHAYWNESTDVALLRSIQKLGWPEAAGVFGKLSKDDDLNSVIQNCVPKSSAVSFESFEKVANRALVILNLPQKYISCQLDLKTMIAFYGFKNNPQGDGLVIDSANLKVSYETYKSGAKALVFFPSKPDILRRLKSIFSRTGSTSNSSTNTQDYSTVYPQIDTNDCNNKLLECLMNAAVRVTKYNDSVEIMALAKNEAQIRYSETNDGILRKVIEELEELTRSKTSSLRQIKNVMRVMCGLEPAGTGKENLFPPKPTGLTRQKQLQLSHESGNCQQVNFENKVRKGPKKTKLPAGDSAIFEGMKLRKTFSDISSINSIHLQLTPLETLILSVLSSQGLPPWRMNWVSSIDSRQDAFSTEVGHEYVITWYGMASVVLGAAEQWRKLATLKCTSAEDELKKFRASGVHDSATEERINNALLTAQIEAQQKIETFLEVEDLVKSPMTLAKKVVMLLEAVKRHFNAAKLGDNFSNVFNWQAEDLSRWAQAFNICGKDGPIACAAAHTFMKNDARLVVSTVFDPMASKTVYSQIAHITCLRNLYMKNGRADMETYMEAIQEHLNGSFQWIHRPLTWDAKNDSMLISSILDHGFSGFDFHGTFGHSIKENLSKAMVQPRVDNIAVTLYAVDSGKLLSSIQPKDSKHDVIEIEEDDEVEVIDQVGKVPVQENGTHGKEPQVEVQS